MQYRKQSDTRLPDAHAAHSPATPAFQDSPYGSPPLTPEETHQAYARLLKVDPSKIDPARMELKKDVSFEVPRFKPVVRRKREMHGGDAEPSAFNEPYDPESDAVRGRNWQHLSPGLKGRVSERLKGTRFDGMDLDSIKVHNGDKPWFMPSWAGGITLENHVYIDPDNPEKRFDPDNNQHDFNLLLEEAIHSGQYQSGMTRFGYIWDIIMKGGYNNSTYEREAWRISDQKKIPLSDVPPKRSKEDMPDQNDRWW